MNTKIIYYLNGRENHKITFRSDDKICLEYLWVILEIIDPKYPVGLYNFERMEE